MAGVLINITSGEVSLAAATAKTVLQIVAATNQRVLVQGIKIMGKNAAGGTDVPVKVRLTRVATPSGTGTTATPAKNDPTDSETLQTSGKSNFTVEPTTPTDSGIWYEVSPQTGTIEFLPPGQEIKIPGGQALMFEATAPGAAVLTITVSAQE
jgi:hypothetical protein